MTAAELRDTLIALINAEHFSPAVDEFRRQVTGDAGAIDGEDALGVEVGGRDFFVTVEEA